MAINPDILAKFGAIQSQIWQTVSISASEAANKQLTFETPLTTETSASALYSELTAPKLVIQFAFASMPENSMVVLLPQETYAAMVKAANGAVESVDETHLPDIRPWLESIVQGLCLSVGNIRNDAFVSSGLAIRFQIFSFPPNLQRATDLIRTSIAVNSENFAGTAMWLVDVETAYAILGLEQPAETSNSDEEASSHTSQPADEHGLEILLDIPLEISVELGRVRMLVKDVIELGSGSIVEIEKAAGEPVDVMVNGRLVARGEVVVIEDNFGVRITEILSPQERLQKLNEVA